MMQSNTQTSRLISKISLNFQQYLSFSTGSICNTTNIIRPQQTKLSRYPNRIHLPFSSACASSSPTSSSSVSSSTKLLHPKFLFCTSSMALPQPQDTTLSLPTTNFVQNLKMIIQQYSTPLLQQQQQQQQQIDDAQILFEEIFEEITMEHDGTVNLKFPSDITWLSGAPGAGKGEATRFMVEKEPYTKLIRVSSLLNGGADERIKDSGRLVSDAHVLKVLLRCLFTDEYSDAQKVIVDGFPRTPLQAQCVTALYEKILWLQEQGINNIQERPNFDITALVVDADISVNRQLSRGLKSLQNNINVERTGNGTLIERRETDYSPELAMERYRQFETNWSLSLQIMKESFPLNLINASGTLEEVQKQLGLC